MSAGSRGNLFQLVGRKRSQVDAPGSIANAVIAIDHFAGSAIKCFEGRNPFLKISNMATTYEKPTCAKRLRVKVQRPVEMIYQTYNGRVRRVSTKRPACMIQRLGYPKTKEEREHLYTTLLDYATRWLMKVDFGEPVVVPATLRTWTSGVESYDDPGTWVQYDGKEYLLCPLVMLRRRDVDWLMWHTNTQVVCDRQWTNGTHRFYSMQTVSEEWNSEWCPLSPVRVMERSFDDAARREKRLNEFIERHLFRRQVQHLSEEAQVFREGLDAMRKLDEKYNGQRGCEDCGSLMTRKCGMCVMHCHARKHRACRRFQRCRACRKFVRCQECNSCSDHCGCEALAQFNINVNHNVNMGLPDVSKLAAAFTGFSGDGVVRRLIIGLPVCCLQLWRGRSWPDYVLAVTALVNSLGLVSGVVTFVLKQFKKMYDLCAGLWKANDDPVAMLTAMEDDENAFEKVWSKITMKFGARAQANVDGGNVGLLVGVVGGLIAIILAAIGLKGCAADDKTLTTFMTRFGLLGRCVTTSEKVYEYGQKISDTIMKAFRVYILKQDPKLVVDFYEMHDWCDRVSALVTTDFEKNIKYNLEMKTKVDALLHEGDQLMKRMDSIKVPLVQRTRFTKLMDTLQRFRGMVAGSGAGCAELRPAPVVVHFVGDSGAGKSTVLWPLFMDVLARMGVDSFSHAKEAVYFRYAADDNKNWDGYHNGSKICVVDDIFTKKDVEASPNKEVDEVIRMANNAYWPLPMAHLQDKGTVHFNSPLVVWTSNRSHFHFPSRTNAEAITTRVSLRYKVTPRDEFGEKVMVGQREVNRLMRDKITAALRNNPEDMRYFVQFQPMCTLADTDIALGPPLTYDEMVE